jgi:serine/threonine protein kinase/tetratricopeptide (TPR) repeat protein
LTAHDTPIDPVTGRGVPAGDHTALKLSRYEIVRELGKGAMGVVYLAKDPLIGRLVALKTIRTGSHGDDEETREFQQRFIREAQAAGILNHPAIVTVHDIGQDEAGGMSFIAMEYVEGQNLKEVLAQGRALSFEQIGEIIAQVAEALDFAHAKGIVHRDVKPANIILLEGLRAKITDFGIAKIASGVANLTTTGQFLGTPNYMAPEQVKGAPVDGRTDIFSLGICLYECLTRRKPFGGDSLTTISYKIVHESFPPLREINPQIPVGYEAVVASCLAKDPARRYQRARDLAIALRAVIRGETPLRPGEALIEEETIVTRDRGAVVGASNAADASPSATRPVGALPLPRRPGKPIGQQLRATLSNVRASPLWRRAIPPAVFFGVIGLLVAALITGIALIRSSEPEIPVVDTVAEARHARERMLRQEGAILLRQGRVADAYLKYEELHRLAPGSPFVSSVMQKLDAIRQQQEVSRAQMVEAERKMQEGVAFLEEKRYAEAIESLQESFTLNPGSDQAAEYLKLAQLEQQKAEAARVGRQKTRTPTAPAAADAVEGSPPAQDAAAQPAQMATVFQHPFTDGRIVVRAGGDIVANEQLWEERPARLLRRAARAPRAISITRQFPAKSADLHIWVTIPAENIQEHHVIPAVRFNAGTLYRLIVRYDGASRRFSYELH